jgi:hypothetical protein
MSDSGSGKYLINLASTLSPLLKGTFSSLIVHSLGGASASRAIYGLGSTVDNSLIYEGYSAANVDQRRRVNATAGAATATGTQTLPTNHVLTCTYNGSGLDGIYNAWVDGVQSMANVDGVREAQDVVDVFVLGGSYAAGVNALDGGTLWALLLAPGVIWSTATRQRLESAARRWWLGVGL